MTGSSNSDHTVQTLAPNETTRTRWQCMYPEHFGFIFVQCCWHRPSLYHCIFKNTSDHARWIHYLLNYCFCSIQRQQCGSAIESNWCAKSITAPQCQPHSDNIQASVQSCWTDFIRSAPTSQIMCVCVAAFTFTCMQIRGEPIKRAMGGKHNQKQHVTSTLIFKA